VSCQELELPSPPRRTRRMKPLPRPLSYPTRSGPEAPLPSPVRLYSSHPSAWVGPFTAWARQAMLRFTEPLVRAAFTLGQAFARLRGDQPDHFEKNSAGADIGTTQSYRLRTPTPVQPGDPPGPSLFGPWIGRVPCAPAGGPLPASKLFGPRSPAPALRRLNRNRPPSPSPVGPEQSEAARHPLPSGDCPAWAAGHRSLKARDTFRG